MLFASELPNLISLSFLYLAYRSPHNPWFPVQQYVGKSRAGKYGDYVVEVDGMLGDILQALKESHLEEDTLVIFTSDNGADWKIDNAARYEHRANEPGNVHPGNGRNR